MRDFLVIATLGDTDDQDRLAMRDRLVASGDWRAVAERHRLCVLLESAQPPAYRHLPGVAGALIGDVYDARAARDGVGADFRAQSLAGLSPRQAAGHLVSAGFGRYLAVFTEGPRVQVLRDPMGTQEALAWTREGLGFVGSRLPRDLTLWPTDLAIDWSAIANILRHKILAHHLSPLVGVSSIEPGVLLDPWRADADGVLRGEKLWAPAWFAAQAGRGKPRRCWRDPATLAQVIDGVTAAYAQGRQQILCEISGGLDSAIVAASLKRSGAGVVYALNHSWPQVEADERVFAQAAADSLGTPLTIVDRDLLILDAAKLARAAGGPRPNFLAGDPDHDADLAVRLAAAATPGEAAALFTGRGGDAVFYQMPAPELALDLIGARPSASPRLKGLASLAARRGTTVWRLIKEARERQRRGLLSPPASPLLAPGVADMPVVWHPWLDDLQDVSPAKRIQLRAIVNSLTAFGESERHRVADILDPLMAQPVVETCLLTPATLLAVGDTDRPFARRAFEGRLPASIQQRRGKGDLSVFFSRSLAASAPFLKAYLGDGRLAQQGLLNREVIDATLDADHLIWRDATPDLFVAMALEAWVRRWEDILSDAQAEVLAAV